LKNAAAGTVSNYIINKSKAYTTGDRRSFICRLKSSLGSNTGSNKRHSSGSLNQPHFDATSSSSSSSLVTAKRPADYKVVHFVGYVRSDLSSNLVFADPSLAAACAAGASASLRSASTDSSSSCSNSNHHLASLMLSPASAASTSSQARTSMLMHSPTGHNGSSSNVISGPAGGSASSDTNYMGSPSSVFVKCSPFLTYHSMQLLNASNVLSTGGGPSEPFGDTSPAGSAAAVAMQTGASSAASVSPVAASVSGSGAALTMQNYLILHGQVKARTADSLMDKFVSKYDLDGKFVYIEPE
jgi:hypothetical protein